MIKAIAWLAMATWCMQLQALELTSRNVDLQGPITLASVRKVVDKLIEFNSISHDPIFLRINSSGGSVSAGFILIDTLRALDSPVYALVESQAYSMAAIIAVFCEKRYMLPHATIMFHEVSYSALGEDPSIRSRVDFNIRYIDQIHREIATALRISHVDYRQKIRDGWWLLADEAKKAGVVDEVVTHITFRELFVERIEIKKTITQVQQKQVFPPKFKPDKPKKPDKTRPDRTTKPTEE